MAKWWKDREPLLPGSLIKIPAAPRHNPDEQRQVPVEDAGAVADDETDEIDDVDLPDRGTDN